MDDLARSDVKTKRRKRQNFENHEIITLKNVSKAYATGAPALNGVDLHINKGEFVFIVGDSGSGKSTMIKLLLRELVPSSGEINVMGYDLVRIRHRKIPKFRRNLALYFRISVCSKTEMCMKMWLLPRESYRCQIKKSKGMYPAYWRP